MTKYHGGKKRCSKELVKAMLDYKVPTTYYCEPFVGMASILTEVAQNTDAKIMAGDIHPSVIKMWQAAQQGWEPPSACSKEQFHELKYSEPSAEKGFIGHAFDYMGWYFGSYIPQSIPHQVKCVKERGNVLRDVTFSEGDYKQFSHLTNAVIYCDPPYRKRNEYRDEDGNKRRFDNDAFYTWCQSMALKGNVVFLSESCDMPDWKLLFSKDMGKFTEHLYVLAPPYQKITSDEADKCPSRSRSRSRFADKCRSRSRSRSPIRRNRFAGKRPRKTLVEYDSRSRSRSRRRRRRRSPSPIKYAVSSIQYHSAAPGGDHLLKVFWLGYRVSDYTLKPISDLPLIDKDKIAECVKLGLCAKKEGKKAPTIPFIGKRSRTDGSSLLCDGCTSATRPFNYVLPPRFLSDKKYCASNSLFLVHSCSNKQRKNIKKKVGPFGEITQIPCSKDLNFKKHGTGDLHSDLKWLLTAQGVFIVQNAGHCIGIKDGMIYDPAETHTLPLSFANLQRCNMTLVDPCKALIIRELI